MPGLALGTLPHLCWNPTHMILSLNRRIVPSTLCRSRSRSPLALEAAFASESQKVRPHPDLRWQRMAANDDQSPRPIALEPLMSIDEVSRHLRISPRGVYRLLGRGDLGALKVGGRTLIEPHEMRRFIADQRRVSATQGGLNDRA